MNSPSLFFLLFFLLLLLLHNFFQLSNKFGHGAGRQALRSWNIQKGIRRGAIFNFGQRRPAGGRGAGRGGAGAGAGGGTGVKRGPAQCSVGRTWWGAGRGGGLHFCSSHLLLLIIVLHSARSSNFWGQLVTTRLHHLVLHGLLSNALQSHWLQVSDHCSEKISLIG